MDNGRAAPSSGGMAALAAPQNLQHYTPDSKGDDGEAMTNGVYFGVSTSTGLLEARDAEGSREVYIPCARCEGKFSRVSYFTLGNPTNGKARCWNGFRCYVCDGKCGKRTTAFTCDACMSWAHFNCFAENGILHRALASAAPAS